MLKASSFPHVKIPRCMYPVSRAVHCSTVPLVLGSCSEPRELSWLWMVGKLCVSGIQNEIIVCSGKLYSICLSPAVMLLYSVFFKGSLGMERPEPMTLRRGFSSGGVVESLVLNTACAEFCLALNYWLPVFSRFSETLWLVYFMIASKAMG